MKINHIIAILAYLATVAIPALILTGTIDPNYAAVIGLAGAWVACLIIGICCSGETEQTPQSRW